MVRLDFNEKDFKKDFYKLLSEYPEANNMVKLLEENCDLVLFGGAIREYIDSKFDSIPRDFDIVLRKKKDDIDLDKLLLKFNYKKNRFDGYKIIIDSLEFDIWEIQNTWAFKENKVVCQMKDYVNELQRTVFLNIDSIVYNLNNEKLYANNYKKAMKRKTLDIILEDNPYKDLNYLRAILFRKRYNMSMSEKLIKNIVDYTKREKLYLEKLYEIQFSHYNDEKVTKDDLSYELDQIIKNVKIYD